MDSAKVSTFGSAVVDAFYVRGPDGGKVTDSRQIASVEMAIQSRVARTDAGGGD